MVMGTSDNGLILSLENANWVGRTPTGPFSYFRPGGRPMGGFLLVGGGVNTALSFGVGFTGG
jgi:hypothetical protein